MPVLRRVDFTQAEAPPDWRDESIARIFELQRYFQVSAPIWSSNLSLPGLRSAVGARFYPAAHENLERIVRELVAVRHESEEDEYGPLRATEYAFSRTVEGVAECYALMRDNLSTPLVSTDSSGGIRLTWIRGGRQVRAVFPGSPSDRRYLYHEGPAGYGAIHDFDGNALAKQLNWLRGE